MDIREIVKNTLNESNLTNPSKLYTPFTLFAVYFAIYFKADILGRIFLSDDWAVTQKALADLKNPGLIEWFTFAGEVTVYSLLMLFLYGIAQAIAVSIWATSNRINTKINSKLSRGEYISTWLYEDAEKQIEELRHDNKKLYAELASYHTWKPEDITRLENTLKEEITLKNSAMKNFDSISQENKEIKNDKDHLTSTNHKLSENINSIKSELIRKNNLVDFFILLEEYKRTMTSEVPLFIEEYLSTPNLKQAFVHALYEISDPSSSDLRSLNASDITPELSLVLTWCSSIELLNYNHRLEDYSENSQLIERYRIEVHTTTNSRREIRKQAMRISGVSKLLKDLQEVMTDENNAD